MLAERRRKQSSLFLRRPCAGLLRPFDAEDAAHASDIRADLERRGQPIGPMIV